MYWFIFACIYVLIFQHICIYLCIFALMFKRCAAQFASEWTSRELLGRPVARAMAVFVFPSKINWNRFETGLHLLGKPVLAETGFAWNRFLNKPVLRIVPPKPVRLPVSGSVCGHPVTLPYSPYIRTLLTLLTLLTYTSIFINTFQVDPSKKDN